MTQLITLAEQYFNEKGIAYERIPSREGLMAEMQCGEDSYRVFVECDSEDMEVAVYIYSQAEVPEDRRHKIAEFITYINHGWIAFGCLHLDYDDGIIRYLHRLNLTEGVLTLAMFGKMLNYGLSVMSRFDPGMMLVMYCDEEPRKTYEYIRDVSFKRLNQEREASFSSDTGFNDSSI